MKSLPVLLHRPGGIIAAGLAAWPVLAYSVATAAGVDGCVRSHGVVGFMATHGSLMRHTPACPSTEVGLSGTLQSSMTIAVIVATLGALIHLVIASLGSQMGEWIHRIAAAVAALITPVMAVVHQFLGVTVVVVGRSRWVSHRRSNWVPWRRGPPLVGLAAL